MNFKKVLKDQFGYSKFKPNQEEIIKSILGGSDVFAAMPTGGGKSICYQLPSVFLEGITIVVSPLVALMKDQVDEAVDNGLAAAFINSSLAPEEASSVYSSLYRGEIKLLYLSPERLALEGYYEKLQQLPVKFFAVDEAHCLSEWGHDFRPDYLGLSKIKKYFPEVPVAAFTATATEKVQTDIIRILKLKKPLTIRASFNRPEIFYRVVNKQNVLSQIAGFINSRKDQSGIVYRTSRKDVEKTADYLVSKGIKALPYHAGLSRELRIKNQELFNLDKVDVICATIAFGMGINKLNVRYIIHGDLPRSMEGYYQETGRAGRDGVESECLLLYSSADIFKIKYHIDRMDKKKEKDKAQANLSRMVSFASANVCRRKQILEYFNEKTGDECGFCDICTDTVEKVEATEDAQKILSAIARTNQGFGINHIIDIIRGADTEKIRNKGHHRLKTYGIGRNKSKSWWRGIINELIGQQAIFQDSERYNVLCMTELGRGILYGKADFFSTETSASREPDGPSRNDLLERGGFKDKVLFNLLKEKRTEIAQENMVPPYIIFSDKTLKDMALLKPGNNDEFLLVSGVGEKKLEVYGPLFLPVIRAYLEDSE